MSPIRVLLADDHAVVRAGLRNALLAAPGLEIVGEVSTGEELREALPRLLPDFLVVDVAMPSFEPVAALRAIKGDYPAMKVLVVSAYADEAYVVGLLEAGVDGYHLKDQPLADLQLAVQRVLAGERWISGPLVERLVHRRPPAPAPVLPALTRRQRELLRLLAQGCDNRKIAQTMELSVKTVENHMTRLYRALGVFSRLEALNFVMRNPEVLAIPADDLAGDTAPAPEAALTVLLVDDNARYRQQLGRLIGKTRPAARLYEAEDLSEAVRLAERVHPRLALVDVVLRDEDGIQCTRRIRSVSPTTRVVLISAYPDREFHRLGLDAGAVAFLDKKDLDAAAVRQVLEDASAVDAGG
jgi:DNA-binding NarL/FixJ family response regulator